MTLVARAQRGDELAFSTLTHRYWDPLVRYLTRLVKDFHAAQDLAQETLLRAHASLGRLTTSERFRPWLFRIGFHTAIDQLRRKPLPIACIDDVGECVACEEQHPLDNSTTVAADQEDVLDVTFGGIASVLAELPLPYRALLAHRYLEGRTCRQLASRMGWSVANVKVRLHRGRRIVRRQLRAIERRLLAELAPLRDAYGIPQDAVRVRMKF
jgi:RNA polymerase sigma-70 factor (ECF subfamily)